MGAPVKAQGHLLPLLFLAVAFLAACHLAVLYLRGASWQFERLFHLGMESNIPTWFESVLFILAALAAYDCARLTTTLSDRAVWTLVALALVFMSCDEVAMMHESVDKILRSRSALLDRWLAPFPQTSWPILLGPVILAMTAFAWFRLRTCLRGSGPAGLLLLAGCGLFLFATLGIELQDNFTAAPSLRPIGRIGTLLEELFEMIGLLLALTGLLRHRERLEEEMQRCRA